MRIIEGVIYGVFDALDMPVRGILNQAYIVTLLISFRTGSSQLYLQIYSLKVS